MSTYKIGGRTVRDSDADFSKVVASAHGAPDRPLCLCRDTGIPMYVAKAGNKFLLKRMPNSGSDHTAACDSYEPPPELSGLGQVLGTAIQEDLEGTTMLKLDFSLSKSGSRTPPAPSGKETDSVSSEGNKLTLRGMLHFLWEEAGFNRWAPAMENKRSWYVIRKYLLAAAESKTAKGAALGELLYIPESFDLHHKDAINERRHAHLMRIAAPEKGARKLMIAIGEVKEIGKARYGMRVVLKHLPDFSFHLDEETHKKLTKRFESELGLWDAHQGSHLMMVATFGVSAVGVANIVEVALMIVTDNWLPFEDSYEHMVLEKLVGGRRRFMKGLRYNMSSSKPLAVAVLTDIEPKPHALYITHIGADDQFVEDQAALIAESDMPSWLWDARAGSMPELPEPTDHR
ncbi:hypothetical protein DBR42_00895 [Pelomonas sp. HMWF004]|nr:hypothetical protein DBR42_00895 [Pelomonas sp. HMWF004]